jgi:hypothetical protein
MVPGLLRNKRDLFSKLFIILFQNYLVMYFLVIFLNFRAGKPWQINNAAFHNQN